MRLKRTKNQGSYSKEKRKDLAISGEEKEKGLLRGEELFFKNIPMKEIYMKNEKRKDGHNKVLHYLGNIKEQKIKRELLVKGQSIKQTYCNTPRLEWTLWPRLVWLSGLSASLRARGSPMPYPVRAHAWVAGQVPSGGHVRGSHTLMFVSLSPTPPPSLKK